MSAQGLYGQSTLPLGYCLLSAVRRDLHLIPKPAPRGKHSYIWEMQKLRLWGSFKSFSHHSTSLRTERTNLSAHVCVHHSQHPGGKARVWTGLSILLGLREWLNWDFNPKLWFTKTVSLTTTFYCRVQIICMVLWNAHKLLHRMIYICLYLKSEYNWVSPWGWCWDIGQNHTSLGVQSLRPPFD